MDLKPNLTATLNQITTNQHYSAKEYSPHSFRTYLIPKFPRLKHPRARSLHLPYFHTNYALQPPSEHNQQQHPHSNDQLAAHHTRNFKREPIYFYTKKLSIEPAMYIAWTEKDFAGCFRVGDVTHCPGILYSVCIRPQEGACALSHSLDFPGKSGVEVIFTVR